MLNIFGAYSQTATGTFDLEITSGGFDQLAVGGLVSLDGTLNILLAQCFDPKVGTVYRFLLFWPVNLSGEFSSIDNRLFNNNTEYWKVEHNNAGG